MKKQILTAFIYTTLFLTGCSTKTAVTAPVQTPVETQTETETETTTEPEESYPDIVLYDGTDMVSGIKAMKLESNTSEISLYDCIITLRSNDNEPIRELYFKSDSFQTFTERESPFGFRTKETRETADGKQFVCQLDRPSKPVWTVSMVFDTETNLLSQLAVSDIQTDDLILLNGSDLADLTHLAGPDGFGKPCAALREHPNELQYIWEFSDFYVQAVYTGLPETQTLSELRLTTKTAMENADEQTPAGQLAELFDSHPVLTRDDAAESIR